MVPVPDSFKAFQNLVLASKKTYVRGGGKLRKRWKDKKGKIYEWDYQEGHLEVYSKNGKNHLGAFCPETGKQLKPGVSTRSVSP